ncbi:MAG: preprotein translocase subunit SecG [Burkholderiaceae bacterium]
MAWLSNLMQLVQVLAALGVILLVLLQHGKGADMGAAFGGGSSGSLFGATGSANFLSRLTAGLAVLFFVSTLGLAYVSNLRPDAGGSVMEGVQPATTAPASDVPTTTGSAGTESNSQIPGTEPPSSGKPADIPK